MAEAKEDILDEEVAEDQGQEQIDEIVEEKNVEKSKTESYVDGNKNILSILGVVLILGCGFYFYWQKVLIPQQESDAQSVMFRAEQYFQQDSLDLALNGDGLYPGFLDIIDDYSSTPSAELAHYYVGISYLKLGDYESAIEYLTAFDSDDNMVGPISIGATGDAYMELGDVENAANYYEKAARKKNNEFTAPLYLMKAGRAYETLKDFGKAVSIYEELESKYPNTTEGKQIEKYLIRARKLANG